MKTVIFDMDGVIINSEPLHFMVDKIILEKAGIQENEDYLDKFVGYTNPEMWKQIISEKNLDLSVEELIEDQLKMKIDYLNQNDFYPIDGIHDLLILLKKKNISMAVASSSPRIFIESVLNKLNIQDYFSIIQSAEEVEKGKPEPDVFLHTVDLLQVSSSDCFVIEDSANGVTAAKRANIRCVGYQNPSSGKQDLSEADIIVNEIAEIDTGMIDRLFQL